MHSLPLERNYLIRLLSDIIEDVPPQSPPEGLDWKELYRLAAQHSISNMVFYGIDQLKDDQKPPQEVIHRFHSDYKKALAKEATQQIAIEQLLKTFEENSIACIPLKGYLHKHLYPRPDMRLMADIDILFKNEQTEQVKNLMLALGFTVQRQGGNHDIYYKKPFLNIEMHRRLISVESPYYDYLNKTWYRAKLKDCCKFTYELSLEDSYIYLLIHLTKHYAGGGTGIRSFLDIWLYNRSYAEEMDWNYIWAELEKTDLSEFAGKVLGLCEVWFGTAPSNELYDEMAQYIFSSGVYGTKKNSIIAAMNKKGGHKYPLGRTKHLYRLKLFFPPLSTMKIPYPFVEKRPILLPICWALRGFRCLIFKRSHTMQMLDNIQSVSEEDLAAIRSLQEKSGLFK